VVVRFTGRVFAVDVNGLAAKIAKRSGIPDVTDIPIGYRVKIPLELLEPEFLPAGHPRRVEYEASLRATEAFSNQVASRDLDGITVILDAGHGGRDSGATKDGVWESLYVYDIMLRIKRLLEQGTAARVHATTKDGERHAILDRDVLPFSRGHKVLTDPPYAIDDPVVGVNLRWYLANSLFRRAKTAAGDPQKVVFLSLHADSLHPSVRGAMVYIPAADLGNDSFGKSGGVYASRKEVQEAPRVNLPFDERVESEGLSRELAVKLISSMRRNDVPVHPFKPVRDRIIRDQGIWIPAVLRYNMVPAKVLVEVSNLANDQDRTLIQTRAFRQKMADSIVSGLRAYYGADRDSGPSIQIAKAR
jgi:N-acetylmuramoyl-L-alanine amidase